MEFVRTERNSEVHSDWLKTMMMMVCEDVEGLNLVFDKQLDYFFVSVMAPTMGEMDPALDSLMTDSSVVEAVGDALEHLVVHFVSDLFEQAHRWPLGEQGPAETFVGEKYPACFQKLPF